MIASKPFQLAPSYLGILFYFIAFAAPMTETHGKDSRTNILFMISDDMSWRDWGVYGGSFAKTPHIDKLAEKGVRFSNVYCGSPICHPARSVLLTGQEIWRLKEASVFGGTLQNSYAIYPSLLEKSGYQVGRQGKGWAPGYWELGGWESPPTGKKVPLDKFLAEHSGKTPFCYWLGSSLGHRPFHYKVDGRDLGTIEIPPFLPDTPEVRKDLAGYYQEIEQFDKQVGKVVKLLKQNGVLDNTLLIVTSDHGMPWPRGKASLYDLGTRVPFIAHWPDKIRPGRVVEDFVSFADLAPTLLEVADLETAPEMTGKSFLKLLTAEESGTIDPGRDKIFFGLEAHPGGKHFSRWLGPMSCRGVRTSNYLYIQNYPKPEGGGWNPVQAGPIPDLLMQETATKTNYRLCFGPRPPEELYDVRKDVWQTHNLAEEEGLAKVKEKLKKDLEAYLWKTGDPRILGSGDIFSSYPIWYLDGKMARRGKDGKVSLFPKSDYQKPDSK